MNHMKNIWNKVIAGVDVSLEMLSKNMSTEKNMKQSTEQNIFLVVQKCILLLLNGEMDMKILL